MLHLETFSFKRGQVQAREEPARVKRQTKSLKAGSSGTKKWDKRKEENFTEKRIVYLFANLKGYTLTLWGRGRKIIKLPAASSDLMLKTTHLGFGQLHMEVGLAG